MASPADPAAQAMAKRIKSGILQQATTEISLLREELSIKDGRWERSQSRRRPH